MSTTAVVRRCLSELTEARTQPSDTELLARFTDKRDDDAFAALVRRHGSVVLAVCSRVLGPSPDAEDAFQATFLALARCAVSIREPAALPAWLHRTALRTAVRARHRGKAIFSLPANVVDPSDPLACVAWQDVRRVLDEELDRLSEKYRTPLVLCLLDGCTRDEAADRIGVSLNTLKRRLEAGRVQLRARLLRRGVAPVALAAGVLGPDGLRAAVPNELVSATVRLARPGAATPTSWGVCQIEPPARGLAMAATVAVVAVVALGAAVFSAHRSNELLPQAPPRAGAVAPDGPTTGADAHGDPLPAGARFRIGTSRLRDGGPTNQAALSPDGKVLATASEAGITLFDLATGRRLLWIADSGVPNGYDANYSRFAFAPDGKTLFTIYAPGAVSLAVTGAIAAFDPASGKKIATFKSPPAPRGPKQQFDSGYTQLWFPAGSKYIVAVRHNQTVLIDPDTGNEARILGFEAGAAEATPDGVRLFVIPKDGSDVAVYDADGKPVRTLGHTARPEVLGFDPTGTTVAAAGSKSEVRVWDLTTGKVLGDITVPEKGDRGSAVTELALTPDHKTVIAGTQKGVVYRFNVATGKELPPLRGHTSYVTGLFFTDGGKTLVSSSWDHAVIRWDLATGKPLPDAGGYIGYLNLDRSADGKLIAATDNTGRVELLDGATGRRVRVLQETGKSGVSRVAFSPDGGSLATTHQDAKLRVWEPATGRLLREIEVGAVPKGRGAWFRGLAFAPDGRALVASGDGLGTRAFDTGTGKPLWDSPGEAVPLAYLPNGRVLVSGGAWNSPPLLIRDAATGKVAASAPPGRQMTNDVAVSGDGRLVATGDHSGLVYLRDPATGTVLKEWQAHRPGEVTWGVSFGPGGIWLASVGDRTVAVWDTATGTLLRRFEGHTSRANSVRFAPDGRTVLSASMDLTGYVWDVKPKIGEADARTTAQLWTDLGGEPEAAFRAVWLAAVDPKAPAIFGEKLPSPAKPDPDRFKQLVEDLASPDFKTREAAEKGMVAFGPAALALARKAREGTDLPEVRDRLDRVIKGWTEGALSPESWRRRRAVVAMELAGTMASRELLKRWAADAPGTVLSDEAKAALARIDRINPAKPR